MYSYLFLQEAFQHVANAAHLSNRVVAFTQVEVENNEDEEDKKALLESKEQVTVGKPLYYMYTKLLEMGTALC